MDRALCVAPARSWRTDFALERGFLAISCDRRKYASDVRDAGDVILFAARPVPRGHGACKSYAVLRARRRARATRCLRRSSSPCERGEQGAADIELSRLQGWRTEVAVCCVTRNYLGRRGVARSGY